MKMGSKLLIFLHEKLYDGFHKVSVIPPATYLLQNNSYLDKKCYGLEQSLSFDLQISFYSHAIFNLVLNLESCPHAILNLVLNLVITDEK